MKKIKYWNIIFLVCLFLSAFAQADEFRLNVEMKDLSEFTRLFFKKKIVIKNETPYFLTIVKTKENVKLTYSWVPFPPEGFQAFLSWVITSRYSIVDLPEESKTWIDMTFEEGEVYLTMILEHENNFNLLVKNLEVLPHTEITLSGQDGKFGTPHQLLESLKAEPLMTDPLMNTKNPKLPRSRL